MSQPTTTTDRRIERRAAPQPVLRLKGIERHFREGEGRLRILDGAELTVAPG